MSDVLQKGVSPARPVAVLMPVLDPAAIPVPAISRVLVSARAMGARQRPKMGVCG